MKKNEEIKRNRNAICIQKNFRMYRFVHNNIYVRSKNFWKLPSTLTNRSYVLWIQASLHLRNQHCT